LALSPASQDEDQVHRGVLVQAQEVPDGGPLLTEQVHGKFVSATKATGSASYGRCHETFTAKTTAPPPTTETQTTESTESTDTITAC
jgi:hypothetical protein